MERQIFINEMQARFNLRKPRSEKPTNLYLVCRINNKQVKLSTGVKIYPDPVSYTQLTLPTIA